MAGVRNYAGVTVPLDVATKRYVDDAVAAKADAAHTHQQSDVTGLAAALAGKADASALSAYLPTTGGTISGGLVVNGEIGGGTSIYASGTIRSNSGISASGDITSSSTISASGTIASNSTIYASGANIGNSGISSSGDIISNSRISAYGEIRSNSAISASGAISSSTIIYSNTGGFQTQNVRLLANRFTVNDSGTERDIDLPTNKAGTLALTSDIDTAIAAAIGNIGSVLDSINGEVI